MLNDRTPTHSSQGRQRAVPHQPRTSHNYSNEVDAKPTCEDNSDVGSGATDKSTPEQFLEPAIAGSGQASDVTVDATSGNDMRRLLLPMDGPNPCEVFPSGETVRLRRSGQYLQIESEVSGLDQLFYTSRRLPLTVERDGVLLPSIIEALAWHNLSVVGPAYWQLLAGLEPLIEELLAVNGCTVQHVGLRPEPLPCPVDDPAEYGLLVDHDLLDLVRRTDRGLIRFDDQAKVRPWRLIAQIALAWPTLRMVVAVTRIDDARRLASQLNRCLSGVTLFTSRHGNAHANRIVVATYSQLGRGEISVHERDIYIALDPGELFDSFCNFALEGINLLRHARVYGLLACDQTLPPRLSDHVHALFGFDQVVVPRYGYRPLPVDVVFSPIEGGGRPERRSVDLVVKQHGIYDHHLRNRRVVRLAQHLASQNSAALRDKFPEVAAALHGRCPGRVGIFVDSVTHGLTLADQLGWPLVAAATVNEEGLTVTQRAILRRGRNARLRTLRPAVVTGAGMARAGRFAVLIRADGGTGLPAIPRSRLYVEHDDSSRLLLIDFRDSHHPLLRRWSRQRATVYREAGWVIDGEERPTLLDRFLATRPVARAPGR